MSLTYREALGIIGSRVATVELFPYHSIDGDALSKLGNWHTLPSAMKAQEFFREAQIRTTVLKLLVRSHKLWLGNEVYPKSDHFHQAPRTRSFTFNPELSSDGGFAGQKILRKLRSKATN